MRKKIIGVLMLFLVFFTLVSCGPGDSPAGEKYKVTYVTEHGTVPKEVVDVENLPGSLPVLTAEGFKFEGWFYDQAGKNKANNGDKIEKDTILYAIWTPVGEGVDPSEIDPYDPEVSLDGLQIVSNGNNIVYFGDVFTGEGYEVSIVLTKDNPSDPEQAFYKSIQIENYSIDDSKVNYYVEGTYDVTIQARYLSYVAQDTTKIIVKADRYESLGVKHLYAVKCAEEIVATKAEDVKPSDVYAIYTENEYKNGELVLIEERKRSGYVLEGVEDVDFTTPGRYVVYLSLTESYGATTVTVQTFFVVVVR